MEVQRYLLLLRRGWPVIAGSIFVGLVLAAAYLSIAPRTYTASTSLFVSTGPARSGDELQQAAVFESSAAITYAQVIDSSAVLGPVGDELRPKRSDVELSDQVSVKVQKSSTIVDVTAVANDPGEAATIANGVGTTASRVVPGLQLGPNSSSLVRLDQLRLATVPLAPSGPLPQRVFTVGVIIGLCVGLGSTIVVQSLDDRIRRPEDVAAVTAVPLLAVLPRVTKRDCGERGPNLLDRQDPAAAEACRRVRATLLQGSDASGRVAVLPVSDRDGADGLALDLAWSLAEAGRRVVLLDVDPDPYTLADELRIRPDAGLSDVLSGRLRVSHALRDTDHPLLRVVPSGTPKAGWTQGARPREMAAVIHELERECDQLVLRTPPVLASAEAVMAAGITGRYLVSVSAHRTYASELSEALASLGQSPGRALGVVLTGARRGHR